MAQALAHERAELTARYDKPPRAARRMLGLRSPMRLMLPLHMRGLVAVLALSASPLALFAQAAPVPFSDSPVPLPGLARTHDPHPTTAAISEEDLKTRLYIVADDSM